MRGLLRASDTAGVVFLAAIGCMILGTACAMPKPKPTNAELRPPPRVLAVAFERVGLRSSAWVELHAWLAFAARSETELPEPVLQGSALGYRHALLDDVRDEALTRTMRALERCEDERCATAAVTGSVFAKAYLDALPAFLAHYWTNRAGVARGGIEATRAALGPEVEPLTDRLAKDLAITWPSTAALVDIVVDEPAPGAEAPIRVVLATHGTCFAGASGEQTSVHDARIIDCVLAYAALSLDTKSALALALADALQAAGHADDYPRAWTALVVHATTVVVTGFERRHTSALRRSAAAAMPQALEWLLHEWPSRMRGEPAKEFAKRYAEVIAHGSP